MAQVLGNLGAEKAWVVNGSDGLDELTTTGPSYVAEIEGGTLRTFEITPEDAGLPRAAPSDLLGGDAEANAAMMHRVLDGEPGPLRNVVLFTAAAALLVAGRTNDLKEGVDVAARAIDSGAAKATLEKLIAITNEEPPAE